MRRERARETAAHLQIKIDWFSHLATLRTGPSAHERETFLGSCEKSSEGATRSAAATVADHDGGTTDHDHSAVKGWIAKTRGRHAGDDHGHRAHRDCIRRADANEHV